MAGKLIGTSQRMRPQKAETAGGAVAPVAQWQNWEVTSERRAARCCTKADHLFSLGFPNGRNEI
jgi:hypothetical protein